VSQSIQLSESEAENKTEFIEPFFIFYQMRTKKL